MATHPNGRRFGTSVPHRLEVDANGNNFYPALLEKPHLIDQTPSTARDLSIASNITHLNDRIARLETLVAQLQTGSPEHSGGGEELVELNAKSSSFSIQGIKLPVRRLLCLARAHGLPVRTCSNSGESPSSLHYMTGTNWRILLNHIGTPTP